MFDARLDRGGQAVGICEVDSQWRLVHPDREARATGLEDVDVTVAIEVDGSDVEACGQFRAWDRQGVLDEQLADDTRVFVQVRTASGAGAE